MAIADREAAIEQLQRINYYRLSGYWYTFRRQRPSGRDDSFYPGTSFTDVVSLYGFDAPDLVWLHRGHRRRAVRRLELRFFHQCKESRHSPAGPGKGPRRR
ncbi:Abi family protein [Paenarthrobacter sp. NPDC089322]|uniref:Abi family protein n=1 Tax=Paenarthrobacter sp. NPDC089322 TaxID=3155065 RepID=UPI003427314E